MNTETIDNIWKKTKNLITAFKKYDLEQRIKKTATRIIEKSISGNGIASKIGEKDGVNSYVLPISNNDNILPKIRILIENFKKYDLEKRISKFAIQTLNTQIQQLLARDQAARLEKEKLEQEQAAREQAARLEKEKLEQEQAAREQEQAAREQEQAAREQEEQAAREQEEQAAREQEQAAREQEQAAREQEQEEQVAREQEILKQQNSIQEKILTSAKNTVTAELNIYSTKNLANIYSNNTIDNISEKLQYNTTLINSIKQTAVDAVSSELTKTQIKDVAIKEIEKISIDETSDMKSLEKQLLEKMDEFEALVIIMNDDDASKEGKIETLQKIKETEKQITELLEKNSLAGNITDKDTQISALKSQIADLEKKLVLSNVDIEPEKQVTSDTESLIKNIAENEVKRDLEEIAKKTSDNAVTDVVPSTTVNIENDLRNAALVSLYRALLEVPIKPLNVKTPPSEYDVLITDKTYDYDKKTGKRKEIPELTKYDSILAK